jgi:hypothetical protein
MTYSTLYSPRHWSAVVVPTIYVTSGTDYDGDVRRFGSGLSPNIRTLRVTFMFGIWQLSHTFSWRLE